MSGGVREVMLVRHPETEANVEKRLIGRGSSPFTERGRAQLEESVRSVGRWAPEALYTSPLERTRAVADGLEHTGVHAIMLDDLVEIDFGAAEGLTWSEMSARGIVLDYTGGGPIAPEGETGAAFDDRVRRAAATIATGPPRVAVVTHGGVFRRLLSIWLELPIETAWRFAIPNAAIAVVRFTDGYAVMSELRPPR